MGVGNRLPVAVGSNPAVSHDVDPLLLLVPSLDRLCESSEELRHIVVERFREERLEAIDDGEMYPPEIVKRLARGGPAAR